MSASFHHLRSALTKQPWAIMEDRLEAICEVLERRLTGYRLSPEEIQALKGPRMPNGVIEHFPAVEGLDVQGRTSTVNVGAPAASTIAVISIMGIIAQHMSQVDDISGPGGTSTERLAKSLRAALADPAVKAIVFNVDSPGGSTNGVEALAEEIYKSRGKKPMVAQVNSLMASAAYWIGAAADEVVMTPGAQAGSIGVYALHRDVSKAAEMQGIKYKFISQGKYKTEGNSLEALSEEGEAAIQSVVNKYYNDFTRAVAKFRGVKVDQVRNGFGQGRIEKDYDAVELGMADRVATLDETLRRLSAVKSSVGAAASAEAVAPLPAAAGERPPLSASLPVATAQVLAAASPIMFVGQCGNEHTYVAQQWPANARITPAYTRIAEDSSGRQESWLTRVGDDLIISAANGVATYRPFATAPDGDLICGLVSCTYEGPPPPTQAEIEAEQKAKAASDLFRRRRHAHRKRSLAAAS